MIVEKVVAGPLATNAYLVGCDATKKAAVIDPAKESAAGLVKRAEKKGLFIEKIFLTHSHWDHIADLSLLKKKTGALVYVHRLDRENVQEPGSDGIPLFFPIDGEEPDVLFEGGEKVSIGSLELEVIFCPGHSPGGVSYFFAKEGVLFSGDTLFQGTMGNLSLPTAEEGKMWDSLKRLSNLPPETKVFPGHGPDTTIGKESWLKNAKEFF